MTIDLVLEMRVQEFGGPSVLVPVHRPDPTAGPGAVVVRVEAVDVLFLDTVIRRGDGVGYFPIWPPYVPGTGVAGTVVGSGERVLLDLSLGGYASHVVTGSVIPVPGGVSLTDAAALLHDGRTAYGLLETTPVRAGDRVLVTAAGGGLGLLLVQLAAAAGAQVVGAARGAAKLAAATRAGAAATIDYSVPGWADDLEVDVVYDGAGGDIGRAAFGAVAPGGRFSAHGAPGGFAAPDPAVAEERGITVRGIEQVQFNPAEVRRLVARALAGADRIRPVIGATFPLEKAADAHAAVESRSVAGKTLLVVN